MTYETKEKTEEKVTFRNPFKTRPTGLEEALCEIERRDICMCAGFLRGFSQRELLGPDEREMIRLAGHILQIVCNKL